MKSKDSKSKTVWMVINHPMHLATLLVVADQFRKETNLQIGLIYFSHDYWSQTKMETYGNRFFRIIAIEKILEPAGWRDLSRLNQLIFDAKKNLEAVSPNDFLLFFDLGYTAHNVVLSFCKTQARAVILHESLGLSEIRQFLNRDPAVRFENFRKMNLLEHWQGLDRTVKMTIPSRGGGVSEWGLFLKAPLEEIFQAVFVETFSGSEEIKASNKEFPRFQFVKPALENISSKASANEKPKRKKVVYFSGGWGLYYKKDRPQIVEALNQSLDYIRRNFPGCQWCYRPHPFFEGEESFLRLEGFHVERDGELAQVYLLEQRAEIECVGSDLSSCTVLAATMGISSLCFGRLLPIDEQEKKEFIINYSLHPSVQFLNNFNEPLNHDVLDRRSLEDPNVPSLGRAVIQWAAQTSDSDIFMAAGEKPPIPESNPAELEFMRNELQRLRLLQAENRNLRVALEQKEIVIQELKKAADERLALIEKLSRKK